MLCISFCPVRAVVRLLRTADPGDVQPSIGPNEGRVLRRRHGPTMLHSVQHLLPSVPQGVPEQRHGRRLLFWQQNGPSFGPELLHPLRSGQGRHAVAFHLQMDGKPQQYCY